RDEDPIDAADWLLDFAHDLIFLSRTALEYAEGSDLRDAASAATRALELTEALLTKVSDGYEGLARPAKRGSWRKPASTGPETH
ncbi:hypothetical protein O4J55_16215, partial [Paracoccus sp. PXZ]